MYIATRVDGEVKNLIEKVCAARGLSIADFLRYLVKRELAEHNYLPEAKKAFGTIRGEIS